MVLNVNKKTEAPKIKGNNVELEYFSIFKHVGSVTKENNNMIAHKLSKLELQ